MVLENQKTSKSGSRFPTVPWARDRSVKDFMVVIIKISNYEHTFNKSENIESLSK